MEYQIKVNTEAVDMILFALGKCPLADVIDLYFEIRRQVQEQNMNPRGVENEVPEEKIQQFMEPYASTTGNPMVKSQIITSKG